MMLNTPQVRAISSSNAEGIEMAEAKKDSAIAVVAGGTGAIGSAIARKLQALGFHVIARTGMCALCFRGNLFMRAT